MGERLNEGAAPDHRHNHAGGRRTPAPSPADALHAPALEAFLADTLRRTVPDAEAEQRAVAAFLAAREAGAHRARTRRRDDWRPRHARVARPVRSTFAVLLAGLTLGGVAYAAVGGTDTAPEDAGKGPDTPSKSASDQPGASAAATGGPSQTRGPDGRPSAAQDTEAHCRSYERLAERGNALESTAWQRLVRAAGGEDRVEAYCAEVLRAAEATARPGTGQGDRSEQSNGQGTSQNNGQGTGRNDEQDSGRNSGGQDSGGQDNGATGTEPPTGQGDDTGNATVGGTEGGTDKKQ
ncbi:hypothetical protein ABZZ79_34290 [Streptomyces sp. NPDC006458]|uniref:hypothetical protein n=1 Tax=Streptomyces sp. NPDC006458 TaxID=3154302 RepID=UPI0033B2335E